MDNQRLAAEKEEEAGKSISLDWGRRDGFRVNLARQARFDAFNERLQHTICHRSPLLLLLQFLSCLSCNCV